MKVIKDKCVGCGLCVENCPVGAIKIENNISKIDESICINCGLCQENCPVDAIEDV